MKQDYRSEPVKKIVVMGESNAFGMCATEPRNEWVQVLANLIRDFQDEPLHVLNNSIPANVISPKSPGHAGLPDYGKPSAIERYERDMIRHQPDIAVFAYGLNDSRCGYDAMSFLADLEYIVADTVKRTSSLIVLASPCWNTQYDIELWESLPQKPAWVIDFSAFAVPGRDIAWSYVVGIRQLAEKFSCLFVDLFTPTEGCTWLLNSDQCHYNDAGHRVLGQLVFNAIACNCSFVGNKSRRIAAEGGFDVPNTGGAQGMSRMIGGWLAR